MNLSPVLALAGLAAIGLLASRLRQVPWRRVPGLDALVAAGAPLVLLGLVLGPGIDLLDRRVLQALAPATALAIGWMGARLGTRFEWRYVRRIPRRAWLVAGLSTAATVAVVAIGAWALTRALPALAAVWTPRLPAILTLAAAAAASGPGAVALVARAAGLNRTDARALSLAATLETVGGALVLTVPLALYRTHPLVANAGLAWLALIVLAAGCAALVGAVGVTLPTTFGLLAVLVFGAGIGFAAGLSPFVICALAATLIVNASTPARRHAVRRTLAGWERPMLAVVLIVAGALLALPSPWILLAVPLLAATRGAARWVAVRYGGSALHLAGAPPNIGLGTVAQGGTAIAFGLNFYLMSAPGATGGAVVLTTVVLGVACALLAAPPLLAVALRARAVFAEPAALPAVGEPAELTVHAPAEWPQ